MGTLVPFDVVSLPFTLVLGYRRLVWLILSDLALGVLAFALCLFILPLAVAAEGARYLRTSSGLPRNGML